MKPRKLSALVALILLSLAGLAYPQGSITNATLTAGATTNYTYNFTLGVSDTLFPAEVITITFPAGFNVANVLIAGSSSIGGGFSVSPSGQNIVITRDATGDTVTNQSAEITFGVVTNPTAAGGSHTISLSTASGFSDTAGSITITPGVLDHFAFATISTPQTAGTSFNITMTAQDEFNNTVTSFGGTVNLTDDTGTISPGTSSAFSSGVHTESVTITAAQSGVQITATNASITGISNTFTVDPGSLAGFAISTISDPQTAGTGFSVTFTAQDANSNTVTGFNGTVSITTTSGTLTPTTSGNFSSGVRTETITYLNAGSGSRTISVNGSSQSGTSNSFSVNAGALDHFTVSSPTPATPDADNTFSFTVSAFDANGNPVSLTNVTVTLSDNTGTLTPTSVLMNGATATVSTANITKAQSGIVTTASGGGALGQSSSFTVDPGALNHYSVTNTSGGNIGTQTVDSPFNVRIIALDQFENIVTSHAGSGSAVSISLNSGNITPTTSGLFTSGQITQGVTITSSGNDKQINVSGSSASGSSNLFNVTSASVDHFVISSISSSQTSGTPFGITITAEDGNNNTATDFTGTVNLSLNSGTLTPTITTAFIGGVWNGNIAVLNLAGSSTGKILNADDGATHTGSSNSFTVNPGTLDHFTFNSITSQTAGQNFNVTVNAQDANNNAVSHTGTVTLSDNTGTLTASSLNFVSQTSRTITDANITKAQSGVVLTASGSGKLGQSSSFTVDPASLDHFAVTNTSGGNIGTQGAGSAFNIRLVAQDQFNNTVTGHTSPVSISINTGTITPSSSGSFTAGVLASQSVTIPESGADRQITVSGGTPTRTGNSNLFNVTSQSVQSFTISTISSPQEAGIAFLVTVTAKDGLNGTGNVATDFTGTVDLSLNTGTLTPTVSGSFTGGIWSGNVTVQSLSGSSSGKILNVANSANASHTGSSNSFSVNPGTPAGSVALTPNPNTLPADGSSTSQITSGTIFDSFSNSVGGNKLFTVTLSDQNLGTITTPDADLAPGHQVQTNSSSRLDFTFRAGTTGGTVTVNVSSVGGSATGNTNISIGSMNITSVSAAPSFVSRGQTGINVQMAVQNLSTSPITNLAPSLTFTGPGGDRTSQYTVVRTDGITTIPAQGQATFTWNVSVGISASLELITIDGTITGDIGVTPVSSTGAATPDSWTVQIPAQVRAENVISPVDTVVLGQQSNTVTVQIANPASAGAASAVIDDIRLRFLKDGVTDRTSDFPFTPLGGNPASVAAGGTPASFDFTVNVGATADTGSYVIDFQVDAHDTNSTALTLQDLNATVTDSWIVKGAPTLQILSLTPQPVSTFRAGQTDNWIVRMAVRNNGPDAIDLNFSAANTFIRFIIGVDVTSQYTVVQPTQLAVAGTNRLNSGVTDTLDFTIDVTGTTTGTATITGQVQGVDIVTSNAISDDTQDGGTGVVVITSQSATVSIAATSANTPNVLQEIGVVNTGQSFQVRIDIDNDLDEPVENVVVRLTTNGNSQITQSQLTIPLITSSNSAAINFAVSAAGLPNSNGETFTAQILSATGQQTQQPAPIGSALDNTAIFRIQTPANLRLQFTKIDTFPTANEIFDIEATVTNSGESLVDNSGQLQLTLPASYTLVSGNLTEGFTVNLPVPWQVRAPSTATVPETFTVSISQSPLEFNTDAFAGVSAASDSRDVQTRETDLEIISFSIIDPAGATDNILSTDQRFTLQATITATENIESIQADLTLPQDYQLASGSSVSQTLIPPGQTQATWQIDAPNQPHNPRAIQVRMRGFDSGVVRADTTAQFNLTAVLKATMDFDHFQNNTSQILRLSIAQQTQLTALVKNIGQAGVNGSGTLTLDLGGTGIIPLDPQTRTFDPDVPVVWDIIAPNVPTAAQSISVTLLSVPQDENTNDLAAFNLPTVRTIQIETGDVGGISIDNVVVSAPQGAVDGVISSEQQFTITADYSWQNASDLSASIVLPTGYGATSLTQNLNSQSGNQSLLWQITAPVNATPQQFIKFSASGKDASNPNLQVSAQPDSLPFVVEEKAQLAFNAAITAPLAATDRIVTIGQVFTVTASLPNTGEAALVGQDTVKITLPAGYTTVAPLVQPISAVNQVEWQVVAPDDPTSILDIVVEIIDRNARDENTNQLPPLTPAPPRVTIPVQTQSIGLNLTLLNQRKPATMIRGGTNQPVFGLRFENTSDTEIRIESINLTLKDNLGADVAPNSVLSGLVVADYDNGAGIETASPAGTNPIAVVFGSPLRLLASQARSIEFLVSVAQQTEAKGFLLTIESPQEDIRAIDVGSNDQVDIRDDSLGFKITNTLSVGVVGLIDAELEASFFNFPNPFGENAKPTTTFNYNLQQASDVSISIYTLLGELVKTFRFNAVDPQGRVGIHANEILWDGTNSRNQRVRNGVYVAVLVTNAGQAMCKIAVSR